MGDLIEKVAQSIFDKNNAGMRNCHAWDSATIEIEHPGVKDRFRGYARAAIAAVLEHLREPSAGACDIGAEAIQGRPLTTSQADTVFTAMIDAVARENGITIAERG